MREIFFLTGTIKPFNRMRVYQAYLQPLIDLYAESFTITPSYYNIILLLF